MPINPAILQLILNCCDLYRQIALDIFYRIAYLHITLNNRIFWGYSMKNLTTQLPVLVTKNFIDDWKIVFYQDYDRTFLDADHEIKKEIKDQLDHYLAGSFSDFRKQIDIVTVPFLVSFFYKEKLIRISSPRLNDELFLLEQLEIDDKALSAVNQQYQELKKHTNSISALLQDTFPSTIDIITNQYDLPDLLNDEKYLCLESAIQKKIGVLIDKINDYRPTLFERFTDWGLGLTASYALLRVHVLKFLAILPSLDFDVDGSEVKRVFVESFRRLLADSTRARQLKKTGQDGALPGYLVFLCRLVYYPALFIPAYPLSVTIRWAVRLMAKRFIAGETIELAEKSLKKLFHTQRDVTLDQLGELVVSEKEADHYCNEVIKLIRGFKIHISDKNAQNEAGINRAHVSIKVSALCSDFKPYAFDYTYGLIGPRLKKILLAAKEEGVCLNVDSEHYDYRDTVFQVYRKVLLDTPELRDFKQTGIVLQAYLRDAYQHYKDILNLAKERGITMPIRIVKGAYWDAETVDAEAHSFDAPEFLNKEETDLHFRQLIIKIFEDHPHVQLVIASHNFADHSFASTVREELFADRPAIEHQCLDMTYEALSTGMAKMGWAVRNYVPVGSLLVGMAYLVRRIMENSSQVGVLTIMRSHRKLSKMVAPHDVHKENKQKGNLSYDYTVTGLTSDYFNVAPVKTYLDWEKVWVVREMDRFAKLELGKEYPNKAEHNDQWMDMVSSSDPTILVGKIKYGTTEDTNNAVDRAYQAYNSGSWAKAEPIVRASTLVRAAAIMMADRNELSTLISYEAGKTINEALADVDEAVDFLHFYAREEIRLNKEDPNIISRGVMAVISPWNFPIAIPCGMVVSCLVAGNAVVLKSASQTPLIAQKLVDILHAAGIPENIVIHLVGRGSTVGEALVNNEKVAGMVFTGSKEVGMSIAHKMGKRIVTNELFGQKYPTKVITEMGGKNAIIVTANAELDETVAGILYSSFGHSGQKCSAASRVIVDNRVKERLLERLQEAVKDLKVGKAFDLSTTVNPVISMKDKTRLQKEVIEAVAEAQKYNGKVIVDRTKEDHPGYCVGPAVIEVSSERAQNHESYAMTELFGPVVHIVGVKDMDEALQVFNASEYALTGGVFSQSQDDIDYITDRMECGNIYVNRSITGARVGIEPFGGFKLSGTGPKAGGKSYVGSFHIHSNKVIHAEPSEDERGSDYNFYLCRPSNRSIQERTGDVLRGIGIIISRFDELFRGSYGDSKNTLIQYRQWLKKEFAEFKYSQHPNQRIPGQLSYNSNLLTQEHVVVIAMTDGPSFSTIMQFLSALVMGPGVTVIARNKKSFEWWNKIKDVFYKAGISKVHFDVFFPTEELLMKAISEPFLSSVIVDGDIQAVQNILDKIYDSSCTEKRMRSILTPFDAPIQDNFQKHLEQYAWVRSFAVNTMRHGAPMNIDL